MAEKEWLSGMVVSGYGGFYQVRCGDQVINCKPRGRLKKTFSKIYPGDAVQISLLSDGTGMMESIGERRTQLKRPNIVNLDCIVIVLAWTLPDYDLLLLDRLLVMAELAHVRPIICFNKIDLLPEEEKPLFDQICACYTQAGYPVLGVCANTPASVLPLRKQLKGGLSVLAGPSGVGKSSLINVLLDGEHAEVGSVSQRLRRGKHTTRYARILPLGDEAEDGFIADTPGFFTLELPEDFQLKSLPLCYPEYQALPPCRFDGCLHHKEPDCTVKAYVEQGKIDRGRYDRYLKLLDEIRNREVKY